MMSLLRRSTLPYLPLEYDNNSDGAQEQPAEFTSL
jgi:hypothetical protein